MAEEKKKSTTKKTTKKETVKKAPAKKTTTTKTKSAAKPETKKAAPKKVETKKVEVKETTPKKEKIKVVEEKEIKRPKTKVEPKVEKKLTKEEQLERTMIFDGEQKRNLKEVVEKLEKENVVLKDKVVKRSKVNKVIVIILVLLIAAVMATTAIYLGRNIKEKMDAEKTIPTLNTDIYNKVTSYREELNEVEEEKEESAEKTVIKEITLKQFENKIIKKENINVLVSSNTCYFCIQFEPIVEETLKDSGKTIYKVDIAKMSEEEVKQFREYYAFTITPTIFTVKDGIVTAEKLGSMDADTLTAWANENLQ